MTQLKLESIYKNSTTFKLESDSKIRHSYLNFILIFYPGGLYENSNKAPLNLNLTMFTKIWLNLNLSRIRKFEIRVSGGLYVQFLTFYLFFILNDFTQIVIKMTQSKQESVYINSTESNLESDLKIRHSSQRWLGWNFLIRANSGLYFEF